MPGYITLLPTDLYEARQRQIDYVPPSMLKSAPRPLPPPPINPYRTTTIGPEEEEITTILINPMQRRLLAEPELGITFGPRTITKGLQGEDIVSFDVSQMTGFTITKTTTKTPAGYSVFTKEGKETGEVAPIGPSLFDKFFALPPVGTESRLEKQGKTLFITTPTEESLTTTFPEGSKGWMFAQTPGSFEGMQRARASFGEYISSMTPAQLERYVQSSAGPFPTFMASPTGKAVTQATEFGLVAFGLPEVLPISTAALIAGSAFGVGISEVMSKYAPSWIGGTGEWLSAQEILPIAIQSEFFIAGGVSALALIGKTGALGAEIAMSRMGRAISMAYFGGGVNVAIAKATGGDVLKSWVVGSITAGGFSLGAELIGMPLVEEFKAKLPKGMPFAVERMETGLPTLGKTGEAVSTFVSDALEGLGGRKFRVVADVTERPIGYDDATLRSMISEYVGKGVPTAHATLGSEAFSLEPGGKTLLKGVASEAMGGRSAQELYHFYSAPGAKEFVTAYGGYMGVGEGYSEGAKFVMGGKPTVLATLDTYISPKALPMRGESMADYFSRFSRMSGMTGISPETVARMSVERQFSTPTRYVRFGEELPGSYFISEGKVGPTFQVKQLPEGLVGKIPVVRTMLSRYTDISLTLGKYAPVEDFVSQLPTGKSRIVYDTKTYAETARDMFTEQAKFLEGMKTGKLPVTEIQWEGEYGAATIYQKTPLLEPRNIGRYMYGERVFYKAGEMEPIPAGRFMSQWEPAMQEHFGVTEKTWGKMPLSERATVEAKLQAKLWAGQEYEPLKTEWLSKTGGLKEVKVLDVGKYTEEFGREVVSAPSVSPITSFAVSAMRSVSLPSLFEQLSVSSIGEIPSTSLISRSVSSILSRPSLPSYPSISDVSYPISSSLSKSIGSFSDISSLVSSSVSDISSSVSSSLSKSIGSFSDVSASISSFSDISESVSSSVSRVITSITSKPSRVSYPWINFEAMMFPRRKRRWGRKYEERINPVGDIMIFNKKLQKMFRRMAK